MSQYTLRDNSVDRLIYIEANETDVPADKMITVFDYNTLKMKSLTPKEKNTNVLCDPVSGILLGASEW